MSDPVTAAAIIGGTQFGGQMLSAFGSPGGGLQLDPAIQATLSQEGYDLQQFMGQNQAALQRYGIQQQQNKQNALNSVLGGSAGPQAEARDFILSAFGGKPTDANINQLAQFDISGGRGMQAGRDQITNMMAQTGLDPRSPAYARAMAELESKLQSGFGGNRADLMSQQSQQNLATALPLYSALQNGPLAGTKNPSLSGFSTTVKHPGTVNVVNWKEKKKGTTPLVNPELGNGTQGTDIVVAPPPAKTSNPDIYGFQTRGNGAFGYG